MLKLLYPLKILSFSFLIGIMVGGGQPFLHEILG